MPDLRSEAALFARYLIVEKWSVEIRYGGTRYSAQEANKFLDAVKEVQQWILDKLAI
jgi:hypothetical protein